MYIKTTAILFISISIFSSSTFGEEYEHGTDYSFFVGGDVLEMETKLSYDNGTEYYSFVGTRYRLGVQTSSVSVGLEYIPGLSDEKDDPWGNPYSLEMGDSYGIYATLGSLVFLRLGWSSWETRYKDVTFGTSNWQRSSTLDWGLGFRVSIGPYLSICGDYIIKNTQVNYRDLIFTTGTGSGGVDLNSEIISIGVNFSF